MRVIIQPTTVKRREPGGVVMPRVAAAREYGLESRQVMVGYAVRAKMAKEMNQTKAVQGVCPCLVGSKQSNSVPPCLGQPRSTRLARLEANAVGREGHTVGHAPKPVAMGRVELELIHPVRL